MFKNKLIFKQMAIFVVFAAMIVIPLTLTIVRTVNTMIMQEELMHSADSEESARAHREFSSRLIEHVTPFVFYILILVFFLSIFFSRKMLLSLKELQKGAQSMRDGHLDVRLDVYSDDELGDVTRSFNEMAASLTEKTSELLKKDMYINAMLDPMWVVDNENNIVDVNNAFTQLFGYGKDEIVGASIYDFLDDRNSTVMRSQLEEKREKGISSIYEIRIIEKGGSQIPVLISGSPIYSQGKMVGKIGIFKDFREQERLRNELARAKDYIETIMDGIEDDLLVIDREYRIIRANKTALMHSRVDSLVGNYCHVVSHGVNRPCWTEGMECPAQNVFLTGRTHKTTHQHEGLTGDSKYQEITASPIKDSDGNVLHVVEMIRDVTERVEAEQKIYRKNREMVALNSVAGILNRSLRSEEIFSKVLDRMTEMLGMDGGGIYFIDEIKREMFCHYHKGISEEFVSLMGRIRLGDDIPGRVAVSGQIISTSDLSKDRRLERTIIKHSGIKGYCCIPIRGKERIIGVFCLFSFKVHDFTAEEESILTSVGEMTGIAIENIKLYEKMKGLYEYQRKRREDEQAQMLSLSGILGSAIELGEMLPRVLDLIKTFFSADFGWLLVMDSYGNLVLKSATSPLREKGLVIYQKGISSIEGYSSDKKTPKIISDLKVESNFYISQVVQPYQSAIALPLVIGERSIGVMSLYYLGRREFKEEEQHFLKNMVNIIAVSLERSEYYQRAIIEKGLADTILKSVADGIMTVDMTGTVLSVNTAFEKLTGTVSTAVIGRPMCDVIGYGEENAELRLALAECLETAGYLKKSGTEAVLTNSFGSRIPVLISGTPIVDTEGHVTGVVNLFRDISREKEIDRMKTEIIRSVSHEFRTPLSAIVGMTEMILDGEVKDGTKYLKTIHSEGIRLSNMVSELLSIARIESGKESMKLGTIDLVALFKSVSESFALQVEKKKASINYDLDGVSHFVGDEEKMRQLLMNLVDNSLMFSDTGCTINMKARKKEDGWEFVVSDNGWGIPKEDLPHLTKRFYRGRHGEKIKGTGLGLALCSEILKMHGGSMEIKSRPGGGTEVVLSLPYREVR